MARKTVQELREQFSSKALSLMNLIRRVFPSDTVGGLWQIEGYELEDEDGDGDFTEGEGDDPVEVFAGIGVYARPLEGSEAEAVLAHIGADAEHPVIIATRDEDARRAYVAKHGDIAPGERAIFAGDGSSRVILKPDGDVIIEVEPGNKILAREIGGTAFPLVTMATFLGHGHASAPIGPVTPPTPIGPPFVFTKVFEGE